MIFVPGLCFGRISHRTSYRQYSSTLKTHAPLTLMPGQMVFVITHEEISLPNDICGTVYSRNRLQKQNILALNAGHVDPGYTGPIIIRLINLGPGEWPLTLGDAVFTAVFHTLESEPTDTSSDVRSKSVTLLAARTTAAQAFSNPFHDLYKDELEKHFLSLEARLRNTLADEFFRRKDIHILAVEVVVALVCLLAVFSKVPWQQLWEWVKGIF